MELNKPITVNSVELPNRIVMAPMATNLPSPDGTVTDHLISFLEERAIGGTGMIIPGYAHIDDEASRSFMCQLGIYHNRLIPKLSRLTEAIHRHGSKTFLQIAHGGRNTGSGINGYQPVAPSAIRHSAGNELPRELTLDEIADLAVKFGDAALRSKLAGFDGVELHGAHGYLIAQFMSPHSNKRRDEYGGSFEGRMAFPLEVLERVRERVGKRYPVGFRFSADEYLPDGVTVETGVEIGKTMDQAGVDYLHVSASTGKPGYKSGITAMYEERGTMIPLAEKVKKAVDTPVIAVGCLHYPALAEEVLQTGKADMIAVARGLIADPYIVNKIKSGRTDELLPCIRCNECSKVLGMDREIRCTVNPLAARESSVRIEKTSAPKSVMVVGGGPAGMVAARIARLRGHRVMLYDKRDFLGGNAAISAVPRFKRDIKGFIDYLIRQMEITGVKVSLGNEVSIEVVNSQNPDVIILATGAVPLIPEVTGSTQENILSNIDAIIGKREMGDRVLVVGGGFAGCEVGVLLRKQGKDVSILTGYSRSNLAPHMEPTHRRIMMSWIEKEYIEVIPDSEILAIEGEKVICIDRNWKTKAIEASTVVFAKGMVPDNTLYDQLTRENIDVKRIGDCLSPRNFFAAVHDGFEAGLNV